MRHDDIFTWIERDSLEPTNYQRTVHTKATAVALAHVAHASSHEDGGVSLTLLGGDFLFIPPEHAGSFWQALTGQPLPPPEPVVIPRRQARPPAQPSDDDEDIDDLPF